MFKDISCFITQTVYFQCDTSDPHSSAKLLHLQRFLDYREAVIWIMKLFRVKIYISIHQMWTNHVSCLSAFYIPSHLEAYCLGWNWRNTTLIHLLHVHTFKYVSCINACHRYASMTIINLPLCSWDKLKVTVSALVLGSEPAMVAEPVKADRMWMTDTCLDICREIIISDLGHVSRIRGRRTWNVNHRRLIAEWHKT